MTRAVVAATLLLVSLAIIDWINPIKAGLTGTYYANAAWTDPPAMSIRDPQPSNDRIKDAWRGTPPRAFSVTWAGSFLVIHDGPYAIATISDDGSSVYVMGRSR